MNPATYDRLNQAAPLIMHIDLNSAFATTEQQAHPSLREKPIGVTNRLSPECCVLAASYEAKALGIRGGMRLSEARALCPELIVLESDAPKYSQVYQKLIRIMRDYSPNIKMKSIDEGVLDFHGMEAVLKGRTLIDIGHEIRGRVEEDMGEWMKINIGIGPNRFLAKQAAGWHKPSGTDQLDHTTLMEYYKQIELTDLTGIAERNAARLNAYGIMTPLQFVGASEYTLKKGVFRGITGTYWYRRLRGYEIDDRDTRLGMIGRQWVVKDPTASAPYLDSCLSYLCETTGMKLRYRAVEARGICVWMRLRSGESWQARRLHKSPFYTNQEVYRRALELFRSRPSGAVVTTMGLYCYHLAPSSRSQPSMFEDVERTEWLTQAVDEINDFYGAFTVHQATSMTGRQFIKQKIPFGGTEYFDLLLKRA
jgi:DNA polymerase-4